MTAPESAQLDDVANELATWPGIRLERRPNDVVAVIYDQSELGILDLGRRLVELPFLGAERDSLVEHGDAEPADSTSDSSGVSHEVRGPSDVTAALELFDRRYHDIRGDVS
jgi:hypothetical protein